ncbi:hypothetical protein EDB84DRAFT_1678539 [Lactarius hengduanensis]|nr:hypothetical protein EDB84DRAFT_1678539 [Lactarius hengduanensis]
MDPSNSYAPPKLFSDPSPMDLDSPGGLDGKASNVNLLPPEDRQHGKPDPGAQVVSHGAGQPDGHLRVNNGAETKVIEPKLNAQPFPVDLAAEVKGMYRLLDLINESGSNGFGKEPSGDVVLIDRSCTTVDKVIIARESLERFVNAMCPGAFASITKVDFKALDQLTIKPLGIYGSKHEIVRMLRSITAVDDNIARLLLEPTEIGSDKPTLSSGLYIITASPTVSVDERHYVIYWPEDSTWDDSAASSVRRNRVTFMRYLTKICDQVVALLSAEQSASIVWHSEDSDAESVDTIHLEVAKTNELEEGAVSRPGFQMISRNILPRYVAPDGCRLARQYLFLGFYVEKLPRDLDGYPYSASNAIRGFGNKNAVVCRRPLTRRPSISWLIWPSGRYFLEQCEMWSATKKYVFEEFKKEFAERYEAACQDVIPSHLACDLTAILTFPMRPQTHVQIDKLSCVYLGFDTIYRRHLEKKFDSVKGSEFKFLKERLMLVRHLHGKNQDLDPEKRGELIRTLLSEGNLHEAQKMLPISNQKKETRSSSEGLRIVQPFFGGGTESEEESVEKEMKKISSAISDSEFLIGLKSVEIGGLQPAMQEVEALAHTSLASSIDDIVKKMTHAVLHMQQESCKMEIQKKIQTKQARVLSDALVNFIRDLNSQVSRTKEFCRTFWKSLVREALEEPKLEFWVHLMDLSSGDKHNMQMNRKHIPCPTVNTKLSSRFNIPIGLDIAYESSFG